jgi:hypothetical protein
MRRLRGVLVMTILSGVIAGCGGDDQPNTPAQPTELGADFAQKSQDMMKAANVRPADPKAGKAGKK